MFQLTTTLARKIHGQQKQFCGHNSEIFHILTLKRLGGQFNSPCGFSKNVFSKERVKPCFFVTFNIIISHTFPENFIEIPQVVQKI